MLANDHPQDSIPAFVLGTLDIDEALLLNAHVIQCPECRAEVETFQALLGALPYAATPRQPPPHVKRQLLARIAAAPSDRAGATDRRPARTAPRWSQAIAGGALALSLALGLLLYDINSRIASLDGELIRSQLSIAQMTQQLTQGQQALARMQEQHTRDQAALSQIRDQHQQAQQALARMQEQITRDQQMALFIAAPQTLQRALNGSDRRARATMYMQPNKPQAVLVVEGMPRAASGTIYQLWLAKPGVQVPSATFDVSDDGMAVLQIQAPAPVSLFDQVMVTIEAAGGASSPSDKVVLRGWLSTALPVNRYRAD